MFSTLLFEKSSSVTIIDDDLRVFSSSSLDVTKSRIAKKNDTIDIIKTAPTATATIVWTIYQILPGFEKYIFTHIKLKKSISMILRLTKEINSKYNL